jgi:acyl-CoA thioester hydrolase
MGEFKNSIEIQVRFNDVDILGHVSNTVYQTYFDTGKTSYLDEVIGDYDFSKEAIVGASIRIEYLEPIFMKTRILVFSRVSRIGHKSFDFEHQLVDAVTRKVLSTCVAVMVCYNPQKKESILIPERWREKIKAFEGI